MSVRSSATLGDHATRLPPQLAPRGVVRPEIQALRAFAVLSVVFFHLWPGRLSGGYAGVDIFFAISGFLITSHLIREFDSRGSVSLSQFWARRIRRLLPAALLVLVVSTLATFAFVPQTQWTQNFREILASALYFENWRLAGDSVDYLAAENAASTVQHYWSLSVEEQFYVVWPLLLVVSLWVARPTTPLLRRRVMGGVLAVVFAASLAYSVVETTHNPGPAYFVTPTRMWEFSAGGLLALLAPLPALWLSTRLRLVVFWAGIAALALTVIFYTSATPFPGYTAALPVLGALAIIFVGLPEHKGAARWLVSSRPVQFIGDVSYSLYLWHWPLIIVVPFMFGRTTRGLAQSVGILVVSLILAALTKRLVEDPLRATHGPLGQRGRAYGVAGVAMALVAGLAVGGLAITSRDLERGAAQASQIAANDTTGCFGAGAFLSRDSSCSVARSDGHVLPGLAALASDTGGAFGCYDQHPTAKLQECHYGSNQPGAFRVALVGDSHGAQLLPGLRTQLDSLGWSLDAYVGRGCTWMVGGGDCAAHQDALQRKFETGAPYDLIIVTARRNPNLTERDVNPEAARYATAWKPVLARGTKIVAVKDNPMLTTDALACITVARDSTDVRRCSMSRAGAFKYSDPLPAAVKLAGRGASIVDMTDAYCSGGRCPLVVGDVIVYRDRDHLTATFSRTLGPFLASAIEDSIGPRRD